MIEKITNPQEIRNIFDSDNVEIIKPSKKDIKNNDILTFTNKHKVVMSQNNRYILNQFYNDDLECIEKPEYTIETIERPQYVKVYQRSHLPK